MEIPPSPNTLEPLAGNNLNPAGISSVPQQKSAAKPMGKKKIKLKSMCRAGSGLSPKWIFEAFLRSTSLAAAASSHGPCPADLLDPLQHRTVLRPQS